ncbi:NADPH-dependent oxidoreductase [Alloprevotella sp. OH1205_COT-284]|uniref:NADPH-dependent FMN reductase n=1 Tax=Alloprevotella sp. OH1205_COT-284 TaxID=2491043 RepID=UPI000F5DA306|nr:NAD(P)H-dependent oxidoreductase [Alloprevotella sp. OH1205_COT-284]RRD79831.1 NADPH-dependent oxidoreductase [Alloprevotella sp. OH1205_COT-284]
MKVLAFAGSSSRNSINKALVKYALSLVSDVEVIWADLNDYEMPIYSVDREKEGGIPPLATKFKEKITEVDAIVCSLAEHNGAFSTAFKNIYDWVSRIDMNVFEQKPMLLMSTSLGERGGASVIELAANTFPWFGANIVAKYSLPNFNQNFDMESCVLSNLEEKKLLEQQVDIWFEKSNQR